MNRIIICFFVFITSAASFAFSGVGAGTDKSPYLIQTPDELFEVRNDLNACYRLETDVDLTNWIDENSPTLGWISIGSEEAPFTGVFDGNRKKIINLAINRPFVSNVGLFGVANNADISNIVFVNPQIIGQDNVGVVLGYAVDGSLSDIVVINPQIEGATNVGGILGLRDNAPAKKNLSLTLTKCRVVGGTIEGKNNVGGIIGQNVGAYHSDSNKGILEIKECHNSANVHGVENCGGICGSTNGKSKTQHYICDSYSVGNIAGTSNVGGVLGYADVTGGNYHSDFVCERNYVRGNILGVNSTCGIVGLANIIHLHCTYDLSSNVCIADTIKGNCAIASDAPSSVNYTGSKTILLTAGNNIADMSDELCNGTIIGNELLKKATTYEGIGWDFSTTWADMSHHNEYPSHRNVSPAPFIDAFEAKSKGYIGGTASFNNGTVYCIIDKALYTSDIVDGKWDIVTGNIPVGKKALVIVCENNKLPSSPTYAFASNPSDNTHVLVGDSNSDGIVDAADVVVTCNYILGKPSSSFNSQNADINKDGLILVDDAVGTVNVIMNNQ